MRLLTALLIGSCLTATGALAQSTGSYVMSDVSLPKSSQQSGNFRRGRVGWRSSSGRPRRPSPPPLPRMSSSTPRCSALDHRRYRCAGLLRSDPSDVRHHRFQARGDRWDREPISSGEGTFQGNNIAGLTVLTKDTAGLIESIRVYYRPYNVVVAFSADLAGRLAGEQDCRPLPRVSVTGASLTCPASAFLSPSFRPATAIPS